MKAEHLAKLARIARKPGLSHCDQITVTRRLCRQFCMSSDEVHNMRRQLRKAAVEARAHLPFTARQVTELEQLGREYRAGDLARYREALTVLGESVLRDSDHLGEALGFDRLADLLSINPAHREQARKAGGDTLRGLAFIARAEESTTRHGDYWGDGGPLFRACLLAMCEFVRTAPDGSLPDPFAPGGPFDPKPKPTLRIV